MAGGEHDNPRVRRCGRVMTRLEGAINERWLCHPDDPALPDCYTIIRSHEMSVETYAFHNFLAALFEHLDDASRPAS